MDMDDVRFRKSHATLHGVPAALCLAEIDRALVLADLGRGGNTSDTWVPLAAHLLHKAHPYFSRRTFARALAGLVDKGILLSRSGDSILEGREYTYAHFQPNSPVGQNDQHVGQNDQRKKEKERNEKKRTKRKEKKERERNIGRFGGRGGLTSEAESATLPEAIPFAAIVEDLNAVTGKRYLPKSSATRKLIRARWNEGARLDDFLAVHRAKHREWAGTRFEKYLRPSTLYSPTKFDNYRQEGLVPPVTTTHIDKPIVY